MGMQNRRDVIRGGAALASLLIGSDLFGKAVAPRVLILGGTGFIGPHFVRVLSAAGCKLTLFNRGKRSPGLFPDIEALVGDRNGKIDALLNRDWDVVIDDSGYLPAHVKLTCDALTSHVSHYIFISSISAYADLTPPGIDEDYRLATLKDPDTQAVTEETYGGLKASCEQVVTKIFAGRSTIIRPTYIVGPGDTTDRFTYWPVRVSRGGRMLVPGTANDPVQFIDVRDLADFVCLCVQHRVNGTYNVCNPPGSVTMGALLATSAQISGAKTTFVWADTAFLEANKLLESGEIPLWSPTTGEYAGASLVSSARGVAAGLRFRDLPTTVRDTLAWHAGRPAEQRSGLRAGLSPEREAELLKLLQVMPSKEPQ